MQDDLDTNHPELNIRILGVNRFDEQSGNAAVTMGRDIAWLQDVDDDADGLSDAWTAWDVTLRDMVVVNTSNVRVGTINLTFNSLSIPENYEAVRQMLIDAAVTIGGDVNGDGTVSLLDVRPFVDAFVTGEFQAEADINQDGVIDGLDVDLFVALLTCS